MSKEIVWSRMNLKEVTPELPYPITQSAFVISNRIFFLEQYKKMGYLLLPEDTEFTKTFFGRLYFNMTISLKIMADFGSDPDGESYKMSFGGFQPNLIEHDKLSPVERIKMMFASIKTLYNVINIDKISNKSFKMISDIYRIEFNKDPKSLTDKEIIDNFDYGIELIKNDLTVIITGGLTYNYWELRKLIKSFDIKHPDDILSQLVTGTNNIISANQNLELMRLAGYVKDNGLESLLEKDYDKISDINFKKMLDEFLYKFGHRGVYETCIESPRYYENPTSILKIIKDYVTSGMTCPQDIVNRQKKIREDAIEKILNHNGLSFYKKKLFKLYLDKYTHFSALREKNRYHCAMSITLSRRHLLEIGRRFAEKGIIDEQYDIYFLTVPEIKTILNNENIEPKKMINERKLEREINSKYRVPDVFVGEFKPEMVKDNVVRELKKVFTGYAASSGIVQGKVRIIHSPEEFGRFKAGEILVAPTTDPMWSNLFPIAKAVVTEMGGVLSHASIVAREYGTPCVVNVKGIVAALEDGDLIEVDGKSGLVRILTEEIIS